MEQTLLLNATYEPLKVVHWRKAVTLWCQGKVEVISVYEDREIRSVSFTFKLPSVIRLLRRIRITRRLDYVPFSRANIYARDPAVAKTSTAAPYPSRNYTLDPWNRMIEVQGFAEPVFVDADGSVFIGDSEAHRVRLLRRAGANDY